MSPPSRTRSVRALVAAAVSAALVLFGLGAPAWADDPLPSGTGSLDPTVTADALPTVQIDGVAWAQIVVGTTVYVAGDFTTARPAGAAAGRADDHAGQPAGLRPHHRGARSRAGRRP